MAKHQELTEPNAIHPAAFVGSVDPATVPDNDVTADKLWIDTTVGPPFTMYKRNAANTAWEVVGGGPGTSGASGALGPWVSGSEGEEGEQGVPGIDGRIGVDGARGLPGIPGFEGEEGEEGPPGPPGAGSSASLPAATLVGQVLFSVDGLTFAAKLPTTDPTAGWLVDGTSGVMLVT